MNRPRLRIACRTYPWVCREGGISSGSLCLSARLLVSREPQSSVATGRDLEASLHRSTRSTAVSCNGHAPAISSPYKVRPDCRVSPDVRGSGRVRFLQLDDYLPGPVEEVRDYSGDTQLHTSGKRRDRQRYCHDRTRVPVDGDERGFMAHSLRDDWPGRRDDSVNRRRERRSGSTHGLDCRQRQAC